MTSQKAISPPAAPGVQTFGWVDRECALNVRGQRFSTAQAALACRMTRNSVALMLNTPAIAVTDDMTPEDRNPGFGTPRLLTLRCVLHLALTAELSRVGLPQARASHLALEYSNRVDLHPVPGPPADLADGETGGRRTVFRVLYPLTGGDPVGRVESLDAVQAGAMGAEEEGCIATVLIDLDELTRRTRSALGIL